MNAIVRSVSDSYVDATRREHGSPIDIVRARAQHAAYVEGLGTLGFEVRVLPADERFPDGVFVEDQAVVSGSRALVTRSGHTARRDEATAVAAALSELGLEVAHAEEPATLDGGDVLVVGNTVFVGLSGRTNRDGVAAVARVFPELDVRAVSLPDSVLHLKCVCSSPAPGVVLLAEGSLRAEVFHGFRVARIPEHESWAANVVGWCGKVLVGAWMPATAEVVRGLGLEVVPVDVSEFEKGDGSMSCLSILAPFSGSAATGTPPRH